MRLSHEHDAHVTHSRTSFQFIGHQTSHSAVSTIKLLERHSLYPFSSYEMKSIGQGIFLLVWLMLNSFTAGFSWTPATGSTTHRRNFSVPTDHSQGSRPYLSQSPSSKWMLSVSGGAQEKKASLTEAIGKFYKKNFFVLGMMTAVSMARFFPSVRPLIRYHKRFAQTQLYLGCAAGKEWWIPKT